MKLSQLSFQWIPWYTVEGISTVWSHHSYRSRQEHLIPFQCFLRTVLYKIYDLYRLYRKDSRRGDVSLKVWGNPSCCSWATPWCNPHLILVPVLDQTKGHKGKHQNGSVEPVVWIQGVSCPCTPFLSHLLFTTKPVKTMGQPGRALERHTGGMVDDWGQSAPGKTRRTPNFEMGIWGGNLCCAIFPGYTVFLMLSRHYTDFTTFTVTSSLHLGYIITQGYTCAIPSLTSVRDVYPST